MNCPKLRKGNPRDDGIPAGPPEVGGEGVHAEAIEAASGFQFLGRFFLPNDDETPFHGPAHELDAGLAHLDAAQNRLIPNISRSGVSARSRTRGRNRVEPVSTPRFVR